MKGNFNTLIQSDKPVLVDIYAEWCGPCKMQSPVIQQVASEMGEKIKVIKIDADKNPWLTQKYDIRGIPTLMIFRKGEMKYRQAGLHTKPQLLNILSGMV